MAQLTNHYQLLPLSVPVAPALPSPPAASRGFEMKTFTNKLLATKSSPFRHQHLQGEDDVGGNDEEHHGKKKTVKEADIIQQRPPAKVFLDAPLIVHSVWVEIKVLHPPL